MALRSVLTSRQHSVPETTYPVDRLKQQGLEPPQSPSPSLEKMRRSAADGSITKPKEKNLLARLALRRPSCKLKANPETNHIDYHDRWPTVTTLVTAPSNSELFQDFDEAPKEHQRSTKTRGLEAVARPLEWLADRLGSASEHLGHQVELADAKAQQKTSVCSSRNRPVKPGRSTHPYDTGVEDGSHCIEEVQAPVPTALRSRRSAASSPRSRPATNPSHERVAVKYEGTPRTYTPCHSPDTVEQNMSPELSSKLEKW